MYNFKIFADAESDVDLSLLFCADADIGTDSTIFVIFNYQINIIIVFNFN